jgi:hypothetical protein
MVTGLEAEIDQDYEEGAGVFKKSERERSTDGGLLQGFQFIWSKTDHDNQMDGTRGGVQVGGDKIRPR